MAEETKGNLAKERNNEQAAEYIRRLANGEFQEMEITVNYYESKSAESED